MQIVQTIEAVKTAVRAAKAKGQSIALVPTMGYLHAGHISLVEKAAAGNDFVVVSIFVNPTQFGPNEDFAQYPRDLERDAALVRQAGADLVFAPEVREMYPAGFCSSVNVGGITEQLCGRSRPGHFRGVTTVVTKLFNIIEPDRAYFGQKDAQQALVIRRMVADLNMNLAIVVCPIVREADGLAMSSRNIYLSSAERTAATVLSRGLNNAKAAIDIGERSAVNIHNTIAATIAAEPLAAVDYIEIVSADDLKPITKLSETVLIALAVRIGKTRLIDNIMLDI